MCQEAFWNFVLNFPSNQRPSHRFKNELSKPSRIIKALLISHQNHQLGTIGSWDTLPSPSLCSNEELYFWQWVLHFHPYPHARSRGFNYFENDSDPIQLKSFSHFQVPLSTYNLFPPRLFLLYLKLFFLLRAAKDNRSCLLFLCFCSVMHTFRNYRCSQLSESCKTSVPNSCLTLFTYY